jgi:hypothetical protein
MGMDLIDNRLKTVEKDLPSADNLPGISWSFF